MFRVKLCSTQIMDKLMKFNVKKWFYLFFLYLINKLIRCKHNSIFKKIMNKKIDNFI